MDILNSYMRACSCVSSPRYEVLQVWIDTIFRWSEVIFRAEIENSKEVGRNGT